MAKARKKADGEKLRVMTPIGRVSFCHVFEPTLVPGGREEQYNLVLVFEPDTNIDEMKKVVRLAADTSFPDGEWQDLRKAGRFRLPFRKASEYAQYGEPFDNPERIFVSLASRERPGVVDQNVKPIINRSDFYSGCYARAMCYAHSYDTAGNMGVTLFLNNVQKVKDGASLSGRRSPEQDFTPIETEGGKGRKDDLLGDDDLPF